MTRAVEFMADNARGVVAVVGTTATVIAGSDLVQGIDGNTGETVGLYSGIMAALFALARWASRKESTMAQRLELERAERLRAERQAMKWKERARAMHVQLVISEVVDGPFVDDDHAERSA